MRKEKDKTENEKLREEALSKAKNTLIEYVKDLVRKNFYGYEVEWTFNSKDFSMLPSKKIYSAYLKVNYYQNHKYHTEEEVLTDIKRNEYTTTRTEYDGYSERLIINTEVDERPVYEKKTFWHDNYKEHYEYVTIYYVILKDSHLLNIYKQKKSEANGVSQDLECLKEYEENLKKPKKKERKHIYAGEILLASIANLAALIAQEACALLDWIVVFLDFFSGGSMGMDYSGALDYSVSCYGLIMLIAAIAGVVLSLIIAFVHKGEKGSIPKIFASGINLAIIILLLSNSASLTFIPSLIIATLAPIASCVVLFPIYGLWRVWPHKDETEKKAKLLKARLKKEGKTKEDLEKEWSRLDAERESLYSDLVGQLK